MECRWSSRRGPALTKPRFSRKCKGFYSGWWNGLFEGVANLKTAKPLILSPAPGAPSLTSCLAKANLRSESPTHLRRQNQALVGTPRCGVHSADEFPVRRFPRAGFAPADALATLGEARADCGPGARSGRRGAPSLPSSRLGEARRQVAPAGFSPLVDRNLGDDKNPLGHLPAA